MKIIYILFGGYKICPYICYIVNKINIYKMKNLLLKSFAVVLFATFITLFLANVYTSIINIF